MRRVPRVRICKTVIKEYRKTKAIYGSYATVGKQFNMSTTKVAQIFSESKYDFPRPRGGYKLKNGMTYYGFLGEYLAHPFTYTNNYYGGIDTVAPAYKAKRRAPQF